MTLDVLLVLCAAPMRSPVTYAPGVKPTFFWQSRSEAIATETGCALM